MIPWTIEVVQYMMAQAPECYTETYHVTLISNDDVASNCHILYDMETFPGVGECLRNYGVIRGDNIDELPPILRANTFKRFLKHYMGMSDGCVMDYMSTKPIKDIFCIEYK